MPHPSKYLCLLIFLAVTILFLGCDDDEDACAGVEPVSVDFVTGLNFDIDDDPNIIPMDTFREGTIIEFLASSDDLKEYRWSLEADPQVFVGPQQNIIFGEGTAGNVDVTLVGDDRTAPIDGCLLEEERVDSLTKTITIIKREDCAIIGRYRGYRTSDPDNVFEVEVKAVVPGGTLFVLTNFPDGCTRAGSVDPIIVIIFHEHFLVTSGGVTSDDNCPVPEGFATLDEDHRNLIFDFEMYDRPTNTLIPDTFIATKL